MDFKELLSYYKKIIDKELDLFFDKINKEIDDDFLKLNYGFLREYLRDGKRLRPILLIMAYKAFCDDNKIIPAALSVELLHNSTLIHDDVMDEDDFRRDKTTIYKKLKDFYLKSYEETSYEGPLFNKKSCKFAVSNSILCGNMLYALGANCIIKTQFPENLKSEALRIYNNAHYIVNHGQFLDIILEKRNNIEAKDYFEMAEKKTAQLFSASLAIGATLSNAKKEEVIKLENYGKEIAIAFQLIDDIMDISEEIKKGREIGSDIRSGKKTLLVIKAFENSNEVERDIMQKVLGNKNAKKDEIEKAIKIINKNSLDYVREIVNKKIEKAKQILKNLNIRDEGKSFFLEFADYILSRKK